MSKPFISEICCSGACHRGILYIGAFKYLEEIGILDKTKLKKIIGTSIGSFILALYVSGYSVKELVSMILDVDFKTFKDWVNVLDVNILNGIIFRNWTIQCLSKYLDPEITMLQFYEKFGIDFTIVVVSLENGLIYVSKDTRPNMKVFSAIIASMNVPFVFPPYKTSDGLIEDIYIDGGLLDNFAIHLLGPRAFGLTSNRKTSFTNLQDPFSYFGRMTELVFNLIKEYRKSESPYIIELDTYEDDSIIDFDLTSDKKITMYMAGYSLTKKSGIAEKFIKDQEEISKDQEEILKDQPDPDLEII